MQEQGLQRAGKYNNFLGLQLNKESVSAIAG
jgi:hypothetical protein